MSRMKVMMVLLSLVVGISQGAISFTEDFTADPTGTWNSEGTTRFHWVTTGESGWVVADNIQGYEVGTYSRALPAQVTGTDDWNARFAFSVKSTAITYNDFFIGLMDPNGWANSDFAGFEIGDGWGTLGMRARIRDGASAAVGSTFYFSSDTPYWVNLAYTGATQNLVLTLSDANNATVGTSSVAFSGSGTQLVWTAFGLGNAADGMGYTTNGLSLTTFDTVSFSSTAVPEPASILALLTLCGLVSRKRV